MRKGFTLVELSIVLVIIGLLIGGILVAQSLISTSQITSQVKQLSEFDASVMSYKSMNKFLPGDAPSAGGDGDGIIETGLPYDMVTEDITKAFGCEIGRFWWSAMPTEFSRPSCASPFSARVLGGANKNVPTGKMGVAKTFFIASAISTDGNVADLTLKENYYALMHNSQVSVQNGGSYQFSPTSLAAGNYPASPAETLALDTKMDDGRPNTGIVITGRIPNNSGAGGIIKGSQLATNCDNGTAYVLTYSDGRCTPLIRIGGIAGDPQ